MVRSVRILLVGISALILVTGVVWASPVSGTFKLYTVEGFVELLITQGIVPEGAVDKARAFARMISRSDAMQRDAVGQNAEFVEVSVSQLIDMSSRTYAEGEEVNGLILLAKNTSDVQIVLDATRKCQIVYRIFEGDTLLYDSGTTEVCKANEKVTYMLDAGATRMFEVKHPVSEYALPVGTYRIEIEYPGYGMGEHTITITE